MNHGTSLLATAGTGDVLTGILAGLVAQGLSIDHAAIFGTYLHAECAQQYASLIGEYGLSAGDLVQMIPHAMDSLINVS